MFETDMMVQDFLPQDISVRIYLKLFQAQITDN